MDDYFVRFVRFPNRAVRAATLINDDGSYDILVNTRYPEAVQRQALAHELEHIRRGHLGEGRSVVQQEAEARGEAAELKSICCYSEAGIVEKFVPAGSRADFALIVSDEGMRPHYRKGQLLLCRERPPCWDGDAAVFWLEGRAVLRQVFADSLGHLYLLNPNRALAEADRMISGPAQLPRLLGTPLRRRRLPPPRM